MPRRGRKATALCLVWLAIAPVAWASPPELCDSAARRVAARVGVPADILLAVTRAETGRTRHGRFAPWPWTVNIADKLGKRSPCQRVLIWKHPMSMLRCPAATFDCTNA